jgi:hypothetical protein
VGVDLEPVSRVLTVCRTVVELNPKFHPEGRRFLVKPYPKDKEPRSFKLSDHIVAKIVAHVAGHGLARGVCSSPTLGSRRRSRETGSPLTPTRSV